MKRLLIFGAILLFTLTAFAGRQDKKDSPYATARWIAYLNRLKQQEQRDNCDNWNNVCTP